MVQNANAQLIATHWSNSSGYPVPTRERVSFIVACLVRQSLSRQAPQVYLADDCRLVSDSTRRSLWSAHSADVSTCVVPLTLNSYGDRTFEAAGPRLSNSVPVQLRNPGINTGCYDDNWRDTFSGNHEHGAVWLLICGDIEKHKTRLCQADKRHTVL